MNLIVVPKPSGNTRASLNIDEVALASMTLVSLRAALLKEKILSDDEVFLDQGVPMIHAATEVAGLTPKVHLLQPLVLLFLNFTTA